MASMKRRSYTDRHGQKRLTAKYTGYYRDEHGISRRVPLSSNKAAAQHMLAKIVERVEYARAGLPTADPQRPLAEHLEDWEQYLRARGNTAHYVDETTGRVSRALAACHFERIADLSPSRVQNYLGDLRSIDGLSAQTANYYLKALKQFCRWMHNDGRIMGNPVAGLAPFNAMVDVRLKRRAFTDAELSCLIRHAEGAGQLQGLDGADRALLYFTAAWTGLRAAELASLTAASFELASDRATVTVEAGYSKHRRQDVVPLHGELVGRLGPRLQGRPRGERIWPGNWWKRAAEMIATDMAAARAAWIEDGGSAELDARRALAFLQHQDYAGQVADFHALRHTFITRVVKAGASPKEAQTLARHSTITLTMDRYAHVGLNDAAAALERLAPIRDTQAAAGETGRKPDAAAG